MNYRSFQRSDSSTITTKNDASIAGGALQITRDTRNPSFNLPNQSGRAMFSKPFRLWKDDTLASFSTSFLVNISPVRNFTPGEGLAFVIAPDLQIPTGSHRQWLGLTNSTTDGSSSNRFIAVELDTFKQDFDPNDKHIGLNINIVKSNITYNLSDIGVEFAPWTYYTIWVDYNGNAMMLDVYIAQEGKPKPKIPVLRRSINLKEILAQDSYFGFSGSTGASTHQLNSVFSWNLMVEILPSDENGLKFVLLIVISIVAMVIIGLMVVYYLYGKKAEDDLIILGTLKRLPGTPREFRFKDLKKATNNFDMRNKLGEGGFGAVYKGILPKEKIEVVLGVFRRYDKRVLTNESMEVAVKKFTRGNIKGKDDFLSELTIINRLRHRNLVRLEGWCHTNETLLLVYEYLPNDSLDQHLFGRAVRPVILTWSDRYNIISGVASALHYLHAEWDKVVVHRDVKASNIMLDSDYNARLGDFGLARALENSATSYAEQGVAGTRGYIAPECFHSGKASRRSDVYGFGAVVLEVVCGKPALENYNLLVDWVWTLYREGHILQAVDERLATDHYVAEDAERLLMMGLACSHPWPYERPEMETIVQIISRTVGPPLVPPIKPSYVWPMRGPVNDDDSSECSADESLSIIVSSLEN
ncbi:putative L-type lectin-domain containing receptor kinase S.5 [Tasmannia lanceolata]|uniref:putative L-type lectin-domain containing receptor kinase S.5 n=1 Tax=Tasmannia lanceolata TaxID=3420 RepID=UPI004062EB49